jgi:crotonobetainyl-CoA:carnitine CoA-transferase CaiB-like acyl-CoA transferase
MEKLGLGLADFRKSDPRLITASISLFGGAESAGELAGRGGLAIVAEAESSLMSQHRGKDGLPISTPYGLGDMASGLAAYGAIVSALFERERTGKGRHLDIAMIRVLLAFNSIGITGEVFSTDGQPRVGGGRTAGMGIFRASNGFVTIGVNSDSLFQRLAVAMDQPELADNPLYSGYESRDQRVAEVDEIVTGWTSGHTIEEVIAALSRTGVPCGRVNTPADILKNETTEQLSLLEVLDDGIGGVVRAPANPFGFRYARNSLPLAGQDNEQVVGELFGNHEGTFARLQKDGAFGGQEREVAT